MEKYQNTHAFFKAEYKDLVSDLKKNGPFWSKVRDNTISNSDLEKAARGIFWDQTTKAAKAMLEGRRSGKIPNPG